MRFLTFALAAAGVVGSGAVAQAQPAPPPPPVVAPTVAPSPPPAGAEPVAEPAAEPPSSFFDPEPAVVPPPVVAPPPLAPPPPMVMQWNAGGVPQSDTTTPKPAAKPEPKPNPWAFTWLTWNQSASAKILGVGRDFIGTEDEAYTWEFRFSPNYAVINKPNDVLAVGASIALATELTNSDTTTKKRETQFQDMSLGVRYNHAFFESDDKEWRFAPGVGVSALLPTSKASYNEGKYLQPTFNFNLRSTVKMLGMKSDWLGRAYVIPSISYSHLFARSYNPTYADLGRIRQDSKGASFQSDVLSMKSFAMNTVSLNFAYFFPIYRDLYFSNGWKYALPYTHDWQGSDCEVAVANVPGGCVKGGQDPTRVTSVPSTSFDVGLSYDFFEVVRLGVGYNNTTSALGPDGQRRNVLYSPDATFYMDLIVLLDGVYDKVTAKNEEKAIGSTPGVARF